MKTYNAIGYSLSAIHVSVSAVLAPSGALAGATFGFAYLVFVWFFGGLYVSDVIHMGIAHKTLDYKDWFVKFVTIFYNTTGIYINPVTWVNRHRHHHAFSDHDGNPNMKMVSTILVLSRSAR